MTEKYPIKDWEFVEEIENSFNEWLYSNHTEYSLKVEYFIGDCSVEDPKTRENLMRKWIYAAFYFAHQKGRHSGLTDALLEPEEYIGDYGPSQDYVGGWNHYHEIIKEKLEGLTEND